MTGTARVKSRSLLDRIYSTRIEIGPAVLFVSCLHITDSTFIPRSAEAVQAQNLVAGFLWFVAAFVIVIASGLIAVRSIDRSRSSQTPSNLGR